MSSDLSDVAPDAQVPMSIWLGRLYGRQETYSVLLQVLLFFEILEVGDHWYKNKILIVVNNIKPSSSTKKPFIEILQTYKEILNTILPENVRPLNIEIEKLPTR